MKSIAFRLGGAGAIAALAVSAVCTPAHAADVQAPRPGITAEAAVLPVLKAPTGVQLPRNLDVGVPRSAGFGMSDSNDFSITKESFQWLRDNAPIAGATDEVYTPSAADVGRKLSFRVTVSAPGYRSVTVTSNSTDPVFPATPAPIVTGIASPGNTLRGTQKEHWVMSVPVTVNYQWLRNGAPVKGATALMYKLTKADLNTLIVLRAQGVHSGKVLASSYSLPVKPSSLKRLTISPQYLYGDPKNPKWGPYAYGTIQAGDTMLLSNAVWKQAGAKNSVQWLRNGAAIPGAIGTSYKFVSSDVGTRVTVMITGSLKGYADTIVAAEMYPMSVLAAPVAGSMPSITGKAVVGSVLTAIWKKNPGAALTWYRDGRPIAGATGTTYKLTAADRGKLIAVAAKVTAPGNLNPDYMYSPAVVPQ